MRIHFRRSEGPEDLARHLSNVLRRCHFCLLLWATLCFFRRLKIVADVLAFRLQTSGRGKAVSYFAGYRLEIKFLLAFVWLRLYAFVRILEESPWLVLNPVRDVDTPVHCNSSVVNPMCCGL